MQTPESDGPGLVLTRPSGCLCLSVTQRKMKEIPSETQGALAGEEPSLTVSLGQQIPEGPRA